MPFTFDVEAAINEIAAVEESIPEITKSYGFKSNPVSISGDTTLPAVVHMSTTGPQPRDDATIPGWLTSGLIFQFSYTVHSLVLIKESVGKNYPADEGDASLLWLPIANKLWQKDTMNQLAQAAGAETAYPAWSQPSYSPQPWPPEPFNLRTYWSLDYDIIFVFSGAGP